MSSHEGGNIQPQLDREEHEDVAGAKKVVAKGFDGSSFVTISTDAAGVVDVNVSGGTVSVTEPVSVDDNTASLTIDTDDGAIDVQGTVAVSAIAGALPAGGNTLGGVGIVSAVNLPIGSSVSVVDAGNSTTTPLGSGAVFTGTGVDVLNYSFVTVTVFADGGNSADDGMQFQLSTDNTNWDDSYDFNLTISKSNTRRFQFPVTAQYFRVVYTNGVDGQTAFRMQTIFHPHSSITSVHRVTGNVSDDRSCELNKAILVAKRPTEDYVNIEATNGGNLKVAVEEFDAELPAGTQVIGQVNQAVASNPWTVDGTVSVNEPVSIEGNNSSAVTVDATQLDVDDLTAADDVVSLWDATASSFASANDTASGDNSLITAQAAQTIKIRSFSLHNGGSSGIDVQLKDGSTVFFRAHLAANGGGIQYTYGRLKELATNTALNLNLSATGDVDSNIEFFQN